MSDMNMHMKRGSHIVQGAMDQINVIAKAAADEDKAGKWGVDGWIRTIHDLIDVQIRTYAAVVQAAVAGPWWNEPTDQPPQPSEPITVTPTQYARILGATKFRRVGVPGTVIPDYALDLQPDVLPAGATEFRIGLKDYQYVGANYRGTVTLTRAGAPGQPETTKEVTVGL